jgi:hypothetical protein
MQCRYAVQIGVVVSVLIGFALLAGQAAYLVGHTGANLGSQHDPMMDSRGKHHQHVMA